MYAYANNNFYPLDMQSAYELAGTWPDNYVEVDEATFRAFCGAVPDGKIRGADSNGLPIWEDIPQQTNSQLLSSALSSLATAYKSDAYDLNMAYVAAVVNDGSSEAGKVTSVRSQITSRKAQYISDIAAAKAQYPLE